MRSDDTNTGGYVIYLFQNNVTVTDLHYPCAENL